ncbi:MAG TPA: hypothetical protein VHR97_02710 [Candidatus Baltobacteraceae bacterium]|nr:hypothetical protein [Candidatus Baltobacteraceae bacterium]
MTKRPPHRPTKKTPEALEHILETLKYGGTWVMAAAAAGISPDTLVNWRDADPAFSEACAGARARGASELLDRIREEAKTGDCRYATWLLERIAPNEFGRRMMVGGISGGSPIQIEGDLKAGDAISNNPEALKALHAAVGKIIAGTASSSDNSNGKASSNGHQ